jgi:hypothetical protein
MAIQSRASQPTGLGQATASKVFSLANVATQGKTLPNLWGLHAPPGFGKTSLLAQSPKPIFLMTKGETGLLSLIGSGQISPTAHLPELQSWGELQAAIRFLKTEKHDFKTVVIDTLNGAERMMHEYVCDRDFDGDWGERGFMGYMRGYEVACADWKMFLNSLDELRTERGLTIFGLMHTRIKTFKNPAGADYDRYAPEMHDKTWGLTKGWLNAILFGNYEVTITQGNKNVTAEGGKKGKAADLAHRMLYTNSNNPIYDAKNQLGLEPEIEMGDSPREGWSNLVEAIKAGRKAQTTPAEVEPEKEEANA